MTEEGKIIKLQGANAVVRIDRKSICDSCEHKCGMKPGAKFHDVVVCNDVNAELGERVEIEVPDASALKFVSAVYLVPLVLAGVGLFAGIKLGLSELFQLLICVGALAVSGVITYFIDKIYKKRHYNPKIIKITERLGER